MRDHNNNNVPMDVVCEFLGNFTLRGSEETQIQVSEQIASNTYQDLDDLADTLKGYANNNKFSKELREAKESEFFKPYWRK